MQWLLCEIVCPLRSLGSIIGKKSSIDERAKVAIVLLRPLPIRSIAATCRTCIGTQASPHYLPVLSTKRNCHFSESA
jgi:hypothetical protein